MLYNVQIFEVLLFIDITLVFFGTSEMPGIWKFHGDRKIQITLPLAKGTFPSTENTVLELDESTVRV